MKKLILITLFLVTTIAGCKEPIEGCRDSNATNYNAEAEKDCCCEYEANLLVWYNYETYKYWKINSGVDSFFFYMDDKIIGKVGLQNSHINEYWPSGCGQEALFTKKLKLSKEKEEHTLHMDFIKNGQIYHSMILETKDGIKANSCLMYKLK